MGDPQNSELFVQQLTEHQNRLFGYVYSLLGDRSRAADVVQETNLVLWRKIGEFQPDRPFLPWAFAIARYQVLAHLRDRGRDKLLLDSATVDALSDEAERQATQIESTREALQKCLQLLSAEHRELIERRYLSGLSLEEMAGTAKKSAGALKVALLRVRRQLADCVEKRLGAEG